MSVKEYSLTIENKFENFSDGDYTPKLVLINGNAVKREPKTEIAESIEVKGTLTVSF
ncbi:MAG: hypothetical protein WDZ27_05255 [Waddliaceae bacterium]